MKDNLLVLLAITAILCGCDSQPHNFSEAKTATQPQLVPPISEEPIQDRTNQRINAVDPLTAGLFQEAAEKASDEMRLMYSVTASILAYGCGCELKTTLERLWPDNDVVSKLDLRTELDMIHSLINGAVHDVATKSGADDAVLQGVTVAFRSPLVKNLGLTTTLSGCEFLGGDKKAESEKVVFVTWAFGRSNNADSSDRQEKDADQQASAKMILHFLVHRGRTQTLADGNEVSSGWHQEVRDVEFVAQKHRWIVLRKSTP